MGKLSGKKGGSFDVSKFGKNQPPPVEPSSEDPSEDEEEDDEEFEAPSGSDVSDAGNDFANIGESIAVVKGYLADPLRAFMEADDTKCNAEVAKRIYAARAVVSKKIDSVLASTSAFADEYRKMELKHLAVLTEKLYKPRGETAAEEIKKFSRATLAEEGTGLMWSTVFDAVTEGITRRFPSHPFEFTEQDGQIFNHLLNVIPSYVNNDPFAGVAFDFYFTLNKYFQNEHLRCEFHYATAALSLDRVGVTPSAVCGVVVPTRINWHEGNDFERVDEADIEDGARGAAQAMVDAFIPASLGASKKTVNEIKELITLIPRPFFTALFGANASEETRTKLREALVSGGTTERDESADGLAVIRAGALELLPWAALSQDLMTVVRAPMISAMDAEDGNGEMGLDGDEEEEEEGDEDEDSDDDASDEDEAPTKGASSKKNRAEGGAAKKPAAPAPDCKQQ